MRIILVVQNHLSEKFLDISFQKVIFQKTSQLLFLHFHILALQK